MNYTEKIKEITSSYAFTPLYFVKTFGCQQNVADSEALSGMLAAMGFLQSPEERAADVVVYNTCSVREHAEQRVFGHIGELSHSRKPGRIVAVCGCMAAQSKNLEKVKNSYPYVSLMFPPSDLARFPELLYDVLSNKKRRFETSGLTAPVEEGLPLVRNVPPRAWVSVMKGCDNFCSYCIVPYTRGRERSRGPQKILEEAASVIAEGFSEIFLLGQNVNSYKGDENIKDFADLLAALAKLPGDFTVRFMTSHPKDATEKLFKVMAENEKISKTLHLPVQAGSNRILQAMNRGYTREKYLSLVEEARFYMPDLVLTTDIIVGFPGEEEEDFLATLDLIKQARFDDMFTFIYSPRTGTPAALMPDNIPKEEKSARFERLLQAR